MAKFSTSIIILYCLIAFVTEADAHKIYLKDGRTIEAGFCWEEGDVIKYQKFGTVVTIKRDRVKKIIYSNEGENNISSSIPKRDNIEKNEAQYPKGGIIILKNGEKIIADIIWVDNGIIKYVVNGVTLYITENNIEKIVNSKSNTHNKKKNTLSSKPEKETLEEWERFVQENANTWWCMDDNGNIRSKPFSYNKSYYNEMTQETAQCILDWAFNNGYIVQKYTRMSGGGIDRFVIRSTLRTWYMLEHHKKVTICVAISIKQGLPTTTSILIIDKNTNKELGEWSKQMGSFLSRHRLGGYVDY